MSERRVLSDRRDPKRSEMDLSVAVRREQIFRAKAEALALSGADDDNEDQFNMNAHLMERSRLGDLLEEGVHPTPLHPGAERRRQQRRRTLEQA